MPGGHSSHFRSDEYLRRRPGFDTPEDIKNQEMFTGDMSTDSIDFREAMHDETIKHMFMEPSNMTRIVTDPPSRARQLIDKIIGGLMRMTRQWFSWRDDDNAITYCVRALTGGTLAVYVFYILYQKHLNRYLFHVKHSAAYVLEMDI